MLKQIIYPISVWRIIGTYLILFLLPLLYKWLEWGSDRPVLQKIKLFYQYGFFTGSLAAALLLVCLGLLIGIPVRMIKSARQWWLNHSYVTLSLLLLSFLLFIVSLLFNYTKETYVNNVLVDRWQFSPVLSNGIWILFSFSLLHFRFVNGSRQRTTKISA